MKIFGLLFILVLLSNPVWGLKCNSLTSEYQLKPPSQEKLRVFDMLMEDSIIFSSYFAALMVEVAAQQGLYPNRGLKYVRKAFEEGNFVGKRAQWMFLDTAKSKNPTLAMQTLLAREIWNELKERINKKDYLEIDKEIYGLRPETLEKQSATIARIESDPRLEMEAVDLMREIFPAFLSAAYTLKKGQISLIDRMKMNRLQLFSAKLVPLGGITFCAGLLQYLVLNMFGIYEGSVGGVLASMSGALIGPALYYAYPTLTKWYSKAKALYYKDKFRRFFFRNHRNEKKFRKWRKLQDKIDSDQVNLEQARSVLEVDRTFLKDEKSTESELRSQIEDLGKSVEREVYIFSLESELFGAKIRYVSEVAAEIKTINDGFRRLKGNISVGNLSDSIPKLISLLILRRDNLNDPKQMAAQSHAHIKELYQYLEAQILLLEKKKDQFSPDSEMARLISDKITAFRENQEILLSLFNFMGQTIEVIMRIQGVIDTTVADLYVADYEQLSKNPKKLIEKIESTTDEVIFDLE